MHWLRWYGRADVTLPKPRTCSQAKLTTFATTLPPTSLLNELKGERRYNLQGKTPYRFEQVTHGAPRGVIGPAANSTDKEQTHTCYHKTPVTIFQAVLV